jgi:hypothetical protein
MEIRNAKRIRFAEIRKKLDSNFGELRREAAEDAEEELTRIKAKEATANGRKLDSSFKEKNNNQPSY